MDESAPKSAEDETVALEEPAPDERCANCGATLRGRFCADCGQNAEATARPVRELVDHALEALFDFDGRGLRTLGLLMLRPGQLTASYLAGKRASYVPPVRLYLFVSLVFFLVVWATGTAIVQFASEDQPAGGRIMVFKVFAPLERAPKSLPADAIQVVTADGDEPAWVARGIDSIKRALAEPAALNERLYELFPKMMFGLVPFFALVLWGLFARARRYLVEHMIFALHYHSFLFLLGTILIVLRPLLAPRLVDLLFVLPAAGYLLGAMHRVYGQRWVITILKAVVLLVLYYIVFAVSLVGIIAAGLSEI